MNAVRFQSAAGISIGDFLRIIELYLSSSVINIDNGMYIQKAGICIGSPMAPILSNIYFSIFHDNALSFMSSYPPDTIVVKRFVDDFLALALSENMLSKVESIIMSSAQELWFTAETPKN